MPKSVENNVSPPAEPKSAADVPSTRRTIPLRPRTPAGSLRVRAMRLEDIPDVAELEARVFPDPWSADSFLAELDRRPEIGYPIVARNAAGDLHAYAVVWFIVDEAHIGNIAVAPQAQGTGIGTFLLNHILAEARQRDMAFATLEVRPSNRAALQLYQRFGFRQVAVRKNYYRNDREDAHVLAVDLHDAAEARLG